MSYKKRNVKIFEIFNLQTNKIKPYDMNKMIGKSNDEESDKDKVQKNDGRNTNNC